MKYNFLTIVNCFSILFFILAFSGFIVDLSFSQSPFLKNSMVFDLIYLISAIVLIATAKFQTERLIFLIKSLGLVFLLISFIGLQGTVLHTDYQWSHVLQLNLINYIHFGLGVALSITGTTMENHQRLIAS